jgi:hypothetical protein
MRHTVFAGLAVAFLSSAQAQIDAESAYNHYAEAVVAYKKGGKTNRGAGDLGWNVVANAPAFALHALTLDPRPDSAKALADLFAIRGGNQGDLLCAAAMSASRKRLGSPIAVRVNIQRCVDKARELDIGVDEFCRPKSEIEPIVKRLEEEIRRGSLKVNTWCSP